MAGINLEDALAAKDGQPSVLRPLEEQVARIQRVKTAATRKGAPSFFINARTDALVQGHRLEEAVLRGQKYLEAGAGCIFVWGGSKRGGLTRKEVEALALAFQGRLSVQLAYEKPDGLNAREIAGLNVARMSLGPRLWREAMSLVETRMEELLDSQVYKGL